MPLGDASYEQQAQEEMYDAIAEQDRRASSRHAVRWLKTRYPGHCAGCGGTITRGAMAEWHPNGKYLICKRCAS